MKFDIVVKPYKGMYNRALVSKEIYFMVIHVVVMLQTDQPM